MTLKMTSTQVVETSVADTSNNSPSKDYTNPDDQPTTNIDLRYLNLDFSLY